MEDAYFRTTGKHGRVIELYNRDCMEGMQDCIEDNSVDVVVTSPPYNIGVSYSAYDDRKPRREYLEWME